MTTAHELKEELKASLIDGAPHRATGWEWAQAVDRVVEAAVAEAREAAVTGDARDRLEALLVASYGEVSDMDAFVDEMSQRGLYVLTRSDYDELVKRAGRKLKAREPQRMFHECVVCRKQVTCTHEKCPTPRMWIPCSPEHMAEALKWWGMEAEDSVTFRAFGQHASPASRTEGRKGSE